MATTAAASTPSSSSSVKMEAPESRIFPPDALVWAKMRGFPPWPARIQATDQSVEIPIGRQQVVFFGTQETAFIKQTDLFDYFEMRHQFEVPRKHKGFNDGVMEIRVAAGISGPGDHDPLFSTSQQVSSLPAGPPVRVEAVLPPPLSQSGASLSGLNDTIFTSSGRARRTSSRIPPDVFISGLQPRNRTNSSSSSKSRSHANSLMSTLSPLKSPSRPVVKRERKRLDSESSTGSKRNRLLSMSGFTRDAFDAIVNPMTAEDFPMFQEIEADGNSHRSSRSRQSSRNFEEYMNSLSGVRPANSNPPRARSRSNSSGRRSRLISGISDVLDDLCSASSILPHDELMSVLRNLPVDPFGEDEERPVSPELPQGLPPPTTFCSFCGCECQLYGVKWRCTSKFCLKWNGTFDPFDSANQSVKPLTPSTSTNMESHAGTNGDSSEQPRRVIAPTSSSVKKGRGKGNFAALASKIKQEPENNVETPTRTRSGGLKKTEPKEEKLEEDTEPKKRKRVQIARLPSPPPKTNGTMSLRRPGAGRPKVYYDNGRSSSKVEKTPPVGENGQRKCAFCGGQVRPQMCGGNKHRWRCVDKKCRKWYGWVRSNEEIPKDLGRKGRWKDTKLIDVLRRENPAAMTTETSDVKPVRTLNVTPAVDETSPKKNPVGRPPKNLNATGKVGRPKGISKKDQVPDRPKRKYTRRKGVDGLSFEPKRELSPMSPRESRYRPTAMERRVRWWQSEKRRADYSPVRDLPMEAADSAAVFKMLSQSCRAAAVTRADEPGTVSGSMDLLLDALVASFPPLLSMLSYIPETKVDKDIFRRMWESTAINMPMFQ